MSSEEFAPNEHLRWARSLKGWSQAELAEQVGTSFEMVSRWERGVTVPSPHYRRRLCAVLGQSAEELGLVRDVRNAFTRPAAPFVVLASSHADAEKAIVSELKTTLQGRGIALWNSRQLGRPRTEKSRAVLHEVVRDAQVILVIVSPEARSSRYVRDAFEMAERYERPVCGIWIEGEHLEECLPEGCVEFTALIDARERDTPAMLEETAKALEQVKLASQNGMGQPSLPDTATEAVTLAGLPVEKHPSLQSTELVPPQSRVVEVSPPPHHSLESTNGASPIPPALPLPTTPPIPDNRKDLSRIRLGREKKKITRSTAGFLIGLVILLIGGVYWEVHSSSPTYGRPLPLSARFVEAPGPTA